MKLLSFILASAAATACLAHQALAYSYNTAWFTQTLDHFDFSVTNTWQQRYLIQDQYWDSADPNAPILFYTGNEGDITLFAENTGFMWDIAPEFNGLLVFAEHRYFGDSQPLGKASYDNATTLQWLTVEQALADYAVLLDSLKANLSTSAPVIAFGGSYGGMLTAWAREKYPHVFAGGIAASAPVAQFKDVTPPSAYNEVITRDYADANPVAAQAIGSMWAVLTNMSKTSQGRQMIRAGFRTCQDLAGPNDVQDLLFPWMSGAFGYLAMADYPYPASFLGPLPGNPINYTASYFHSANPSASEGIAALSSAMNVFYNFSGQAGSCFDLNVLNPAGLRYPGWDYLACTSMWMPISQSGLPTDMFYPAPWDPTAQAASCRAEFGVSPRPDWARINFGGRALRTGATNTVFSNGNRDPWSSGGITSNDTLPEGSIAVIVDGGAHHYDLRASNPGDTESVIEVRNIHRAHIRKWIAAAQPPSASE